MGAQRRIAAIMVVDDDTAWLAELETWLSRDGYNVVGIARGEWVMPAVNFHKPDVVLLDLDLPGVDGFSILGHLQRCQPQLPVIVMTGFGGTEVERRVRALGAVAYFDKPFRVETLLRTLRLVCGRERLA